MKLIEKRESGRLMTTAYQHGVITDRGSAASFITRVAALEEIKANYIALRDLQHNSDEGSQSRELPGNAPPEEITRFLGLYPYDRLFLSGKYKRLRVGIGIDLKEFVLEITLTKGRADEMEQIAALIDGIH